MRVSKGGIRQNLTRVAQRKKKEEEVKSGEEKECTKPMKTVQCRGNEGTVGKHSINTDPLSDSTLLPTATLQH